MAALATGSDASDIHIDSITAATRRQLLQANGVVVVYTITAYNIDPSTMRTNIVAAVQSGAYTNALQSSGYTGAVAGAAPRFVDLSPTSSPTPIPTQAPTGFGTNDNVLSTSTIIIVLSVIGSVSGAALIIFVLSHMRGQKKRSRVAVYEQDCGIVGQDADLECQAHITHRVISGDASGKADKLKVQDWVYAKDDDNISLDSVKDSPPRLKADFSFTNTPEKKITRKIGWTHDNNI